MSDKKRFRATLVGNYTVEFVYTVYADSEDEARELVVEGESDDVVFEETIIGDGDLDAEISVEEIEEE